jgi:hypothetical protein
MYSQATPQEIPDEDSPMSGNLITRLSKAEQSSATTSGDFYQLAHSWALSEREHYGIVLATPYAGWGSYSTHDQASRPG